MVSEMHHVGHVRRAVGGNCFAAMVRHALEGFQSHVRQHVKPLMLLMDALAVQHKVLQK